MTREQQEQDETYNEAPFIECPACHREFQEDDWYNYGCGQETECPECGKAIVLTSISQSVSWTWKVKP
jgi:ferredoxin-like protein FixX